MCAHDEMHIAAHSFKSFSSSDLSESESESHFSPGWRYAEFLRDLVARDVVRLQHLPGNVMVADLLTKAVARALFASLMDLIRQYAESGVACPST